MRQQFALEGRWLMHAPWGRLNLDSLVAENLWQTHRSVSDVHTVGEIVVVVNVASAHSRF